MRKFRHILISVITFLFLFGVIGFEAHMTSHLTNLISSTEGRTEHNSGASMPIASIAIFDSGVRSCERLDESPSKYQSLPDQFNLLSHRTSDGVLGAVVAETQVGSSPTDSDPKDMKDMKELLSDTVQDDSTPVSIGGLSNLPVGYIPPVCVRIPTVPPAVPEPGSIGLALLSLLILETMRRSKRNL